MFVGQQGVIAASGFLDSPVDDPLRRFADLALSDVEIVHAASPPGPASFMAASHCRSRFKMHASGKASADGAINS